MATDNQVIIGGAKIMENPGLKSHGSPAPFLRVSNRRYASPPPMATPHIDSAEQGYLYNDQMDPLMPSNMDVTIHEDVTQGPAMAGGATSLPVPATNGEFVQDRSVNLRQHMAHLTTAGQPSTLLPGETRVKRPPNANTTNSSPAPLQDAPVLKAMDHTLEDQQAALTQGAQQRRIDTQKQMGGGSKENPTYDRAQQEQVRRKQISRPTHPVGKHPGARVNPGVKAAAWDVNPAAKRGELVQSGGSEEDNLVHFRDPRHRPDPNDMWGQHGDQPMFEVKPQYSPEDPEQVLDYGYGKPSGQTCETCYLQTGDEESPVGAEHDAQMNHPYKPLGMERGQRYSYHDTRDDQGRFAPKGTKRREAPKEKPGKFRLAERELGKTEALAWDRLRRLHPEVQIGPDETYDSHYTRLKQADRKKNPRKRQHNKIIHHVGEVSDDPRWVLAHHDPTQDMHDLMNVQGADGNWNYDEYMHGMFNGMELMRSIHDRDEPEFREAPKKWLYESSAHPPIMVKDYEGREGNNEHITRNEQGMIPVDWVRNMKGARGELPGQHRNAQGDEWEQFKQHVAAGTPGYSSPVFVVVEYGKEPLLYEGNHRRDAYVENGATHLPAEIRYFGHAERLGTVGERAMRRQANAMWDEANALKTPYKEVLAKVRLRPTAAEEDDEEPDIEQDPRGSLEHMINGLPEATSGPRLPFTRPTHDQRSQLAANGFEQHTDPDDWDVNYPWWTKGDVTINPSRAEPRGDYWETQHGDADPVFHLDFQSALNHATRRPEPRTPNSIGPFKPSARPDVKVQTWSSVLHVADEEDDWWAAQPDVVHDMGVSPDAHQEAFMDTGDVEHDLEDAIPRNTSLREHAHVLRNGFRWDGDERYPKYEQEHHRNIIDADHRPAYAKEGQVIERNTHVLRPVLEEGVSPLAHPWMHTYYPAGQSDDRGLVAGYNTADQAVRAAHQLSTWGARHPESQALLQRYQYVGDESPYDPTEMLPHEDAQRMGHV